MRDTPPPYSSVVFDCDSTLSEIEGIDELGAAQRERIAALTEQAMSGALRLEDVYKLRLELVRPSRARLEALGAQYIARAVPHSRELVRALAQLGKRVFVVSGGLEPAVLALARHLEIPSEHVRAVGVRLNARNEYAGFDESSPLARSGGKIDVVRELGELNGARPLALVGDGMTDLEAGEAQGGAERFIAYGGVVRRPAVFERARVTCASRSLAGLVPLLFTADEIDRLRRDPRHAELVRASTAER